VIQSKFIRVCCFYNYRTLISVHMTVFIFILFVLCISIWSQGSSPVPQSAAAALCGYTR